MEGTFEQHALMREAIDMRRLHVGVAAGAEFVVTQIIDQDHQQVRLLACGFFHVRLRLSATKKLTLLPVLHARGLSRLELFCALL